MWEYRRSEIAHTFLVFNVCVFMCCSNIAYARNLFLILITI